MKKIISLLILGVCLVLMGVWVFIQTHTPSYLYISIVGMLIEITAICLVIKKRFYDAK